MATNDDKRETHTTDFLKYDVESISFYDNPTIDALVSSVVALGSEVWTTQRRMKILEAVLISNGLSTDLVDQYEPSSEEAATWKAQRDQFIRRVYGSLQHGGKKMTEYGPGMDILRERGSK